MLLLFFLKFKTLWLLAQIDASSFLASKMGTNIIIASVFKSSFYSDAIYLHN